MYHYSAACRYDEHGKKIWYRRKSSSSVHVAPSGDYVGTVRFATRPPERAGGPSTARPRGYWMLDDRGTYLWYRFVEDGGGQYVRDRDIDDVSASPDQRLQRDKLTWTGVGRSVQWRKLL